MKVCSGQAGPVYKVRAEHPYWKSDPNYEGMLQNVLRMTWPGYPGAGHAPLRSRCKPSTSFATWQGESSARGFHPTPRSRKRTGRIEEIHKIRGGK